MQKVLPSVRSPRALAAHRTAQIINKKRADKTARQRERIDLVQLDRDKRSLIRSSRLMRREDRDLGPLAPRRDVGAGAETYGTVGERIVKGVKTVGKGKDYGIREGDRVVVVGAGERDRGRIGEVEEVRNGMGEVVVRGINMVCLRSSFVYSYFSISLRPTWSEGNSSYTRQC